MTDGNDGRSPIPNALLKSETLAVHAGIEVDPATHAIAPNVSMSVNNALVPGEGAFSLGHQRSIIVHLDTAEMMASTFQLEGAQLEDYRAFAGDSIASRSVPKPQRT